MFQFSGLALFRVLYLQYSGLSHSEISGLSLVCSYPKLIAAYHVLLRLSMPRHPPYALIRFKYLKVFSCSHLALYTYVYSTTKNCFPNMSKNLFQLANLTISQFDNEYCRCFDCEPTAHSFEWQHLVSISLLLSYSLSFFPLIS